MTMTCLSTGATHVGRVRSINEDAWIARPEIGLWAVADGMGGHARGDVASRTVVAALEGIPPPSDPRELLAGVETAIGGAHDRLLAASEDGISGATIATLLVSGAHWAVLWAGDSRVYLLRGGVLEQLTSDHSLVQELADRGEITPAQMRDHPMRNRITRAVGMPGPLELAGRQGSLAEGDVMLLCSDGLTGHLDDAQIAALLQAGPPAVAARQLIHATLDAGASDNVTVVVVGFDGKDPDRTTPGQAGGT